MPLWCMLYEALDGTTLEGQRRPFTSEVCKVTPLENDRCTEVVVMSTLYAATAHSVSAQPPLYSM